MPRIVGKNLLSEALGVDDDSSSTSSIDLPSRYRHSPRKALNTRGKQPSKPVNQPNAKKNLPPTPPPATRQKTSRKQTAPVKTAERKLQEVRRMQEGKITMIPKLPFSRLVKYLLQKHATDGPRITPDALNALKESAEIYLTGVLSDSYAITLNRKQVTLQTKDICLLLYLRGEKM